MSIEHIRLSQQAKEQLIRLKRFTGLQNWNVLCRWAFCISLSDEDHPRHERIQADSSVEMTWKVFGGEYHEVYLALLKERCRRDGLELDTETLSTQFKLHLHRGIAILSDKQTRSISDLLARAVKPKRMS